GRASPSSLGVARGVQLGGRVPGVGGTKGRGGAGLGNGVHRVVLPAANATDLELLPLEVTEGVRFALVRTMDEVLDAVLVPPAAAARRGRAGPELVPPLHG